MRVLMYDCSYLWEGKVVIVGEKTPVSMCRVEKEKTEPVPKNRLILDDRITTLTCI
jgi:hypothetical protein